MVGVQKYDGPVTLVVQFISQNQNFRRTGHATQLTTLAPFYIDYNSSSCHLKYLRCGG